MGINQSKSSASGVSNALARIVSARLFNKKRSNRFQFGGTLDMNSSASQTEICTFIELL